MPDKQNIYDHVSFLSVIKVNNELKKMSKEEVANYTQMWHLIT